MLTPIKVLRQFLKHVPTDCVASLLKQPEESAARLLVWLPLNQKGSQKDRGVS